MENFSISIEALITSTGFLAPPLFILLHIVRPLFFLPVIVVCIAGGVLFGFWQAAFYNFLGLGLMNLVFFLIIRRMPRFEEKMRKWKNRLLPDRSLSVSQVMILRIMPFVHFHLLSFYLMEMTKNLKEYMYYSLLGVLLPSIIYTAFGEAITESPWYITWLMFIVLTTIYVLLNKLQRTRLPYNANPRSTKNGH